MAYVDWTYSLNNSVDRLLYLFGEGGNFLFISFTCKYFSISTLKKTTTTTFQKTVGMENKENKQ